MSSPIQSLAGLAALLLGLGAGGAQATQAQVQVPSLDQREGQALPLIGHWFAAKAATSAKPAPAVLLLHGCGGPYDKKGGLSERMLDYVSVLNAEGWHALVLDSLTPRGEKELCTQKIGTRAVTMTERRRDTFGALQWLSARPEVDAQRLALLGWSNGGSTVLASSNTQHPEVKAATEKALKPRAAVAFYPGCEADLKRGYSPSAPLLILSGGSDDWTAAAPCQALVKASETLSLAKPQIKVYPGAFHGFDSSAPVRLRADVPNGVTPGAGVHVGGQPAAREASRQDMLSFLREQLK
ncbi:dienelactone hydrolase family protein [Roseateles oligotrophus]|uniref:Dienelactone hydrolase family protein n=1 Tax=Roseateles oligotrophus TaxID=1769250 RepID=A0ABT2Y8T8_9BURK|nr:dienelactone hydrolase family protein [Roseateles oligotrophus]MCV2366712.1 dienelactone hydrolase family protein [Roseateles oligotrophus]